MLKLKYTFLFQTGSIKRLTRTARSGASCWGFYSKLVRLKEDPDPQDSMWNSRFYSKLVRLKEQQGFTQPNGPAWEFLFQTGSIKRRSTEQDVVRTGERVSIPNWFD